MRRTLILILLLISRIITLSRAASASGYIEVTPDTHTGSTRVSVSFRVILPSETLDEGLARAQSDLNFQLNKVFSYPSERTPLFKVKFRVNAVRESEAGPILASDSLITVRSGERSHASINSIRILRHNWDTDCADVLIQPSNHATIAPIDLDPNAGSNTLAHETLHLFGIYDRYFDVHINSEQTPLLSSPDNGFDFDIMGSAHYGLSHLTHIRSFVELAKSMLASGQSSGLIEKLTNFDVCRFAEKPLLVEAKKQIFF